MRDDLPGLRALLSVAQKKSFTAAAAELRVTPSAVSQSVRALEDRVGVRLLARTTRNVGLTEAGAQFVGRLQPALNQIGEAFESLGELRARPSGLLRLTMLRTGYTDVFRPILTRSLPSTRTSAWTSPSTRRSRTSWPRGSTRGFVWATRSTAR